MSLDEALRQHLRELERETRVGVPHFKPGQHKAFVDSSAPDLLMLLYVDQMGHVCVLPCQRDGDEVDHLGYACRFGAAGVGGWDKLPDCFTLSDAARSALEAVDA